MGMLKTNSDYGKKKIIIYRRDTTMVQSLQHIDGETVLMVKGK